MDDYFLEHLSERNCLFNNGYKYHCIVGSKHFQKTLMQDFYKANQVANDSFVLEIKIPEEAFIKVINDIEIIIFINNLFFEAFKGDLPCYTPFKNSQDEFSLFIPLRYIFPGLSDKKPIKLIEVNYKSKQNFNMVLWHAYEYNFAFANFIKEKVREKYYIYNLKKI